MRVRLARLRVISRVWPLAAPLLLTTVVVALVSLGSGSLQRTGTVMLINLVAVVGLSIFVSNSGIISFGQVSFMGLGAYTAALLTAQPQMKQTLIPGLAPFLVHAHWPTIPAVVMSGVIAAVFAAVIGLPLMRLSGLSASIATLAILVIVNVVLSQWSTLTGGLLSFVGIPTDTTLWGALPYALISIVVAYLFQRSRVGLRLQSSREDEIAARSVGIHVVRERAMAFVVSAAVVGVSGALYAHYLGSITPTLFYFQLTFLTLAMLVVGGLKSLSGAVVGTIVLSTVRELLQRIEAGPHILGVTIPQVQGLTEVCLAAFLLGILMFRPNGITGGREFSWPVGRPHTLRSPSAAEGTEA